MSIGEADAAMKNPADKTGYDRLQKDVDAVKNDISSLADQVADALNALAGSAQTQARRGYKQARTNVDTVVSDLGRQGKAALGSAQDAATTLGDSLEDAVQQRPLAAMGLALGLGFLIGVTWRR